jgi:uncharacterized protein (DUF305 family)
MLKREKLILEHMIPHHEEAVESSKLAKIKTNDPKFIAILDNIIVVQSQEIADMQGWYKDWTNQEYSDKGVYARMMEGVDDYSGPSYDREWMQSMIFHHQAVIYMSRQGRNVIKEEKLKKLMENIITSQSAQVVEMENLIIENRGKNS